MSLLSDVLQNKNDIRNLEQNLKPADRAAAPQGFLVKNTTGATLDKYSVVEITAGAIDPSSSRGAWANSKPAIEAQLPSTDAKRLAILLQSIQAGKVGRAANSGILKANVNVTDVTHTFATIDGTATLASGTSGEFNLHVCTSGTGTQLAYVSLAAGAGGAGGEGGETVVQEYVEIIKGLSYDSEGVEGRSSYQCRLTTDNYSNWADLTEDAAVGDKVIDQTDGELYQCNIADGSSSSRPSDQETVVGGENDGELYWILIETETTVRIWDKHVPGSSDFSADMRHYIPWLQVGSVYPVRKVKVEDSNGDLIDEYFFELTFIPIGEPGYGGFVVDTTDGNKVIPAVGDTYTGS